MNMTTQEQSDRSTEFLYSTSWLWEMHSWIIIKGYIVCLGLIYLDGGLRVGFCEKIPIENIVMTYCNRTYFFYRNIYSQYPWLHWTVVWVFSNSSNPLLSHKLNKKPVSKNRNSCKKRRNKPGGRSGHLGAHFAILSEPVYILSCTFYILIFVETI